jgi:hypothetical protein
VRDGWGVVGISSPLIMGEPLWDRKFVLSAVLIGAGSAVIVTIVTSFAGKEVAGVTGVVLTALALGFLHKAETVELRRSQDGGGESAAGTDGGWWYLVLLACACPGLQIALMTITAPFVVAAFHGAPPGELIARIGTAWSLASITLGCFVLGFLYAKSTRTVRYFYAASAPPISTLVSVVLSVSLGGGAVLKSGVHLVAAFALLFGVAAVLGTWCGGRVRRRRN